MCLWKDLRRNPLLPRDPLLRKDPLLQNQTWVLDCGYGRAFQLGTVEGVGSCCVGNVLSTVYCCLTGCVCPAAAAP